MKKAAQDGCLYDASRTQQSDLYDMILQAMADRNYENTSEGFQPSTRSVPGPSLMSSLSATSPMRKDARSEMREMMV